MFWLSPALFPPSGRSGAVPGRGQGRDRGRCRGRGWDLAPGSPPSLPTCGSRASRVSLIECGPVDTAFMQKVLDGPHQAVDRTNTRTFRLFHQYLHHSKEIYREEAQHPEEVVKVFLTAMRAPKPTLRYFTTKRFLHQLLMRLDDPFGFDYAAAVHRDVFADDPAEAEAGTKAGAGAGAEAGGGASGMGDPELGDPLAAPQERLRQPLSPAPSFVSWACAVPGDGAAVAAVNG
ncbi:estradiol 17-beta-dehydrogenase 1-like [Pongo pygmaeus]|uniref:estradiol 17-beta-dehydrogenase 1-like n=1 Tax=Pongo pygmaeus TaxID=9600 RepID=UPI00300C7427